MEQKGDNKKPKEKKIYVKVYFNKNTFQAICEDAENAGKRKRGLQLFTQKPHGFANELVSNTDGISGFLKYTWKFWVDSKADRLTRAAELAIREKQLQEEKKKLGVL